MNLILLFPEDFINDNQVRLNDHRKQHMLKIQKVQLGDSICVGLINGKMGSGLIKEINPDYIQLEVQLTQEPPKKLPLTLILALPRPKMLKRIIQSISSLGVEKLILINSYRVEKSFWQSPVLTEQVIQQQLILGLEQAKDTVIPKVELKKLFKPFVEDELPAIIKGKTALVAHPTGNSTCPNSLNSPLVLVIGPEGGFIPYEVEKLEQINVEAVSLGDRILRVETAVNTLVGRLFT